MSFEDERPQVEHCVEDPDTKNLFEIIEEEILYAIKKM